MSAFNFFSARPSTSPQAIEDSSKSGDASVKLTTLLTSVESAIKRFDAIQSNIDSLNARIDQVVSTAGGNHGATAPKPVEKPTSRLAGMSEEELSQLSRKELLALQQEELTGAFTDAVKELLTPFDERVKGLETRTVQTKTQTEFEKFINAKTADGKPKYADWESYFPSMKDNLSKMKGITIFDAYVIAKNRLKETDPNKFAEIEDKHFPKPQDERNLSFGGFRTASKGAGKPVDSLPLNEAVEQAAKELFDTHGPIPDLN